MLKTSLCDLFGIEVPIILAPMGTCTSAELAAAVSNEGGLGGVGSLFRTTAAIKRDIDMVRKLTSMPFAINHIPQTLDAEAFRYTLEARPAVAAAHAGCFTMALAFGLQGAGFTPTELSTEAAVVLEPEGQGF